MTETNVPPPQLWNPSACRGEKERAYELERQEAIAYDDAEETSKDEPVSHRNDGCEPYKHPDGRQGRGVACKGDDGVWRIRAE